MNNMKYEMLKAYKDLPKSDRPDVEYKDLLLPVKHSVSILCVLVLNIMIIIGRLGIVPKLLISVWGHGDSFGCIWYIHVYYMHDKPYRKSGNSKV